MYIHDRAKERTPIDNIVPIEAEALVRAALGEDVDTKGIPIESRMWFEGLALLLIANELTLSKDDVIGLIVQGEDLARSCGYRLQ